ncbi:hypothetical protein HanRHA438_Chr07g0293381 [Helianthus annuus]|nr:hypothetical protein HanIR_Chr07g0304731 [Helianthus annuus]KAJ0906971.1 hypothetical protein HanRHA438_Chr07g0293381 [Helianthus annuus]
MKHLLLYLLLSQHPFHHFIISLSYFQFISIISSFFFFFFDCTRPRLIMISDLISSRISHKQKARPENRPNSRFDRRPPDRPAGHC